MASITRQNIIDINIEISKRYNIPHSIINPSALDNISIKPDRVVFGQFTYNTIFLKSACLIEGIIRLHPFADGNKRTAFGIVNFYFDKNDLELDWSNVIQYAIQIAQNNSNDPDDIETLIVEIAEWLESNSNKLDKS